MKILSLEFNNFISYNTQILDLSNIKVAAIIGSNGSGKSSILEAITYALFGVSRAPTDDKLIKTNTDKMYVQVKFEIDNKEFTIKRIKNRGKSAKLQLLEGINDITGTILSETQKKIEKILNSNYDTFINSAFIPQGRFDEFIKKTSAEKNKIFMSFLDIEKYVEFEEISKQKVKNIETEVYVKENKIKDLANTLIDSENIEEKKTICQLNIETAKKSLEKSEKHKEAIQKKIAIVQVQVDNSSKNVSLKNSISRELNNLNTSYENKVKKLHRSAEEASILYKKYKDRNIDIDKEIEEIEKQLENKARETTIIWSQREDINKRKDKSKKLEGVCYVCNSKISKEQVLHMCEDLDKELLALPKTEPLEKEIEIMKSLITEYSDFKVLTEIKDIDIKIKEKEDQLSKIIIPESLEAVKGELFTLEEDIDRLNYDMDTQKKVISTNERQLGSLLEQEKNKETAIKEIKENEEVLIHYKEDLTCYNNLTKAFSKKGIPSLIIENSLPLIENESNRLLEKFGSNLKVEFIKAANKNESLELQVKDIEGVRDIAMYSGGEKIRIALAIRIALSRLLMLRNDAKIGLFVIDEPTDLDEQGMSDLVNILNILSSEFSQIFIISHIDMLINAFPTTLLISKSEEGSVITIKK